MRLLRATNAAQPTWQLPRTLAPAAARLVVDILATPQSFVCSVQALHEVTATSACGAAQCTGAIAVLLLVSACVPIVKISLLASCAVCESWLVLLSEDDEEPKVAAAAAQREDKTEVAKGPQPDTKPKAKQKGTFSSLLSKQNMHRKGSSSKSLAVKGEMPMTCPVLPLP